MRKLFVQTQNYQNFAAGIKAVEQRGAAEAGILLVHGPVGRGKSKIVSHWAAQAGNNAIFLRANVDWTPKYFLIELAKVLLLDTSGTAQQLFERILEPLAAQQRVIVIDEAEYTLLNNAAVFEKIRDFSDRAEITVVVIGMEKIQSKIARHKQLHRRVAHVVEFKPTSLTDVSLACEQLAEVKITPALVAEVYRLSQGRMSEVLNIIAAIERIAKLNNLESVDVADMEGAHLSYDWQTYTHRTVQQTPRAGGR